MLPYNSMLKHQRNSRPARRTPGSRPLCELRLRVPFFPFEVRNLKTSQARVGLAHRGFCTATQQISVHDDFESLEPQTSGCRQRIGWRSRNASAFEISPNYRGSSANQSGSSPSASRRSMSQEHFHSDDLYHPDQEIFGSHEWWVLPSAASQARGRARANQRGTYFNQRGINTDQRWTYANQRGTNANHRGTNVNTRGRNANQRGTNANQRGTNTNQRGVNANPRASASQPWISNYQRGTQMAQLNQRGTQADLRRLPTSQGSRSLSILLPKRGGLSLSRRRGEPAIRGRPSSSHRGTNVNRGSSSLERGTPRQQRETSPQRPHGSSAAQRRTRVDECGCPVRQRGSPGGRRQSPVDQRRSPVAQRQTRVDECGCPVRQRGSPGGRRGSPVDQRGSPVGQRRSPTAQPRLNIAKGPSWLWRDSSPAKVKFEKPSRTLSLKKWVARWRSKISLASLRRSSAAKSKQEKEHLDALSADMFEYEGLHKADEEDSDPHSLMFRDGVRSIDMVIAFKQDLGWDGEMTEAEERHRRCRSIYQANLIKEGLELELEHKSLSFNGQIWFLKIHIPWATQLRIAEVIGLKLPTKQLISISVKTLSDGTIENMQKKWYVRLSQWFYKIFELTRIEPEPSFYLSNKNYRREEQFLVKNRYTQFSPAQRSLLVMQILRRVKYDDETNQFGISRLLAAQTYDACFPLHEGEYSKSKPDGTFTDRQLLYLEWARAVKWYKKQPLWLVRRYFGDQIGLYYAWLGFYTKMLIAPAIVGSLCFLYGILSSESGDNIPSKEICDTNGVGNITLCPMCDKACSYQKMSEACIFAQMTYLIDNPSTVFFAIFMSFWATTFLVLWKREESVIKWQWDLVGTDPDDNPRPEYEASVTTTRINPVTRMKEPYRSTWQNVMRRVAVSTAVLMMIAISIGSVLGIIMYRISMVAVIYRGSGGILRKYARLFTIITAAGINLAVSEVLIKIYTEVALVITNLENPRTQTDYEDSVTFKMFIFEFINFYATIVYIAFFKGTFYDHPGDKEARKSPFLTIKGDICFTSGCLSELGIMLAVSVIGKQTCHNFAEMGVPMFKNYWRYYKHRSQRVNPKKDNMAWEKDYHLQDPGHMALYEEYLEMIMQYGFVTLFVAAFPLGPLCALINNICEIRMDAYKMVTQARRPMPQRVEDIGAWYGLLRFLTYLAVVSNAFVIAYTSDFIPRMVYKYVHSPNRTLEGYVNHSLSWFNTSDFLADWGADKSEWDPPQCAYRGYRNPPNHPDPYGLSPYYWNVFAARLSFVVVFEHLVFTLAEVIHAIIPKVPTELLRQIKREEMLEKELKYKRKKSTNLEFLKSMVEGKGLTTAKSGDAGVTINWKDEASKKG